MATKSGDLERIVQIRGSNRGVVTKIVKEAELIMSKGRIGDTDVHRLETLSLELDGKRKLLERLDQDILISNLCPASLNICSCWDPVSRGQLFLLMLCLLKHV